MDSLDRFLECLLLFLDLLSACVTLLQTLAHGHLASLPVDLWVMLCKPGEAEDNVMFSKVRDSERGPL